MVKARTTIGSAATVTPASLVARIASRSDPPAGDGAR
jgi:hypothetical protein